MKIKNKLLISNGPFTSIVALSILLEIKNDSDNIYLFNYLKNIHISKHSINYKIITNYLNVSKEYYFLNYINKFLFFKHISVAKLKKDLPTDINEIYLPINSSTKKWYKIFKKIYPNASFILYEEGLFSYIKPIFDRKLRKIMKSTINYYIFYNNQLKDLLKQYCKNIKFNTIIKNSLNNLFIKYSNTIQNEFSFLNKNKYAIILPQYYFENNFKKRNILIDNYKEVISFLISNGYHILLKEHPKSKLSLFNSISTLNDAKHITQVNSNYPIESMYQFFPNAIVFSVYSTSLFTLNYLYKAQTFTSYKMLNNRMGILSIFPTLTCMLTKFFIPDIKLNTQIVNTNINNIFKTNNIFLNIYIKILSYII